MTHHTEERTTLTPLASAVQATDGTGTAQPPHREQPHREQHRQVNWLRDVILGGQDGLVNILGIVLGVIAGGGSKTVLLAAGFAAAITESISMGAVGSRPRSPSATTTRPNKPARRPRSSPPPRPNARRSTTSTPPRASPVTCWTRSWTPSPPTATAGWPR